MSGQKIFIRVWEGTIREECEDRSTGIWTRKRENSGTIAKPMVEEWCHHDLCQSLTLNPKEIEHARGDGKSSII